MKRGTVAGAIGWGVAAGLLGTLLMDLVVVGFFTVAGMPPSLVYSFIGDVAERVFIRVGVEVAGGVLLGALVHLLLGLALGAAFALAVHRVRSLHVDSVLKGALLGVLYIEIVSQPILALAPLMLKMTTPEVLQWYVLSTSMHVIYGLVLGGVVALAARGAPAAPQGTRGRSATSV